MKKALILHAWYATPESDWYPWLKGELEKKGYSVNVPKIPTMDTNRPDMETMLKFLVENKFVGENTLVIGHSLGSVLTLRLAERVKFGKAILLAGWDFNDLTAEHATFWKNSLDYSLIRSRVDEFVCLVSDNDFYISKYQGFEMSKRLNAQVIEVGSKGHFLANKDGVTEVPEILEFV